MMIFSLLAAAAVAGQPVKTTPSPVPAVYVIHGDYGPPAGRGNLGRLLDQWTEEGVVDARPHAIPKADISPCMERRPHERLDFACVGALHPPGPGGEPVVAIVARDSGRVIPVYNVHCIGPSGVGRTEVDMNAGGAFSSDPRQQSEIRTGIADCIAAAAKGAVIRSVAAVRGFDEWGTEGDYAYHRLTGDCERLQHRIGRNATRGSFSMPLSAIRWSFEGPESSNRTVKFECREGSCVSFALAGTARLGATHSVDFETAARARGFTRRLESLKQTCGR